MFEKILVPYDLSEPSKHALEWAVCLGGNYKSSLEVLHVLPQEKYLVAYDLLPDRDELKSTVSKEINEDTQKFLSEDQAKGIKGIEVNVEWGDPCDTTLSHIQKQKSDLVVMGTHGHTGLKRIFLGSLAERLTRHSPAPVLVVRKAPKWPVKKVLVPIDFSDFSEEALLMAAELQAIGSPAIHLIHVTSLPDVALYANVDAYTRNRIQEALEAGGKEKLAAITEQHPSLNAKTHLTIGPAAEEICQFASEIKADMILIPTHGHTGLGRLLLGSVAEHVIRYAPCSVLSFRPKNLDS